MMSAPMKFLVPIVVIGVVGLYFVLQGGDGATPSQGADRVASSEGANQATPSPGGNEAASSQGGGDEALTDGTAMNLTLAVTESALPEGVALEDIEAQRADDIITENGATIFVYDLLPSGAEFGQPVQFTFTLPMEDPRVFPIIIHSSDQGDEFVETTVEYDVATQIATIMGEITHFSTLEVVADVGFDIATTGGGEYSVHGSVPFTFTVTTNDTGTVYEDPIYRTYFRQHFQEGSTFDVGATKVGTQLLGGGALTPKHVIAPGEAGLPLAGTYSYSESFWCEAEGEEVVWAGPISLQFTLFGLRRDGRGEIVELPTRLQAWGGVAARYDCKEPEEGTAVQIPPPYLVICTDGSGASFGGHPVYDTNTIEPIFDSQGNYIDRNTGESVFCPSGVAGTIPPEARGQIEANQDR